MGSFISTERRDAVALVTIDNPPMNALAAALLDELETEVDALDADEAIRAIVLRGAGERAFVAGADIKEMAEKDFGTMVALRGKDIVRVPLIEGTGELKTVSPEEYAEAEVFFG